MPLSTLSFERIISADRDSVFEVFSNYENYEEMIPQHYPSIRIRSVRDNVAIVEEHLNFGPDEFVIMAKHISNKPAWHKVHVIGGDIKGSCFKQRFVEIPEGTKVVVDVEIKFGKLKIKRLFGSGKHARHYEEILDDLVRLCES